MVPKNRHRQFTFSHSCLLLLLFLCWILATGSEWNCHFCSLKQTQNSWLSFPVTVLFLLFYFSGDLRWVYLFKKAIQNIEIFFFLLSSFPLNFVWKGEYAPGLPSVKTFWTRITLRSQHQIGLEKRWWWGAGAGRGRKKKRRKKL